MLFKYFLFMSVLRESDYIWQPRVFISFWTSLVFISSARTYVLTPLQIIKYYYVMLLSLLLAI
jgi:hypothetical protein